MDSLTSATYLVCRDVGDKVNGSGLTAQIIFGSNRKTWELQIVVILIPFSDSPGFQVDSLNTNK